MMNEPIRLADALSVLGQEYRITGREDRWVFRAAPIDDADEECICFCSRSEERGLQMIGETRSRAVICLDSLDLSPLSGADKTFVQVANPRLAFIRLLHRFFVASPEYVIHPTAVIDESADIHPEVSIGPGTVVGDECSVGRGTVIGANVTLYRMTRIGERVTIHSGAVIGADGFGFERDSTGELVNFPQLGGVVIEDDVEVGANTCIDRGTLGDSVIGRGSKIDNLVHIAHNVRVGQRCLVIALAMLGGSVVVGDDSWVAPQACVREGLAVGRNALVGLGAVVLEDVPDNVVVAGVPARILRENR